MRLQRPRNSDDRHDADGERHLLRPQSARRCHLVHAIAVEKLCKRANAIGKFILDRCRDLQDNSNLNCIGDVRGLGAMCAVKLVKSAASGEPTRELTSMLMKIANEKGLILLSCGAYGNVIRFLVPLTASDALVKEGMDIFAASLAEAVNRAPL
jgi:4-aminobutyrate aminotransferase